MKNNVTQNDVAKAAGVTRSMVSYVISGNADRSVAPETRKRILEAIEKLDYRPNKAAQALQQGDIAFASKRIGVILCNSSVFLRPYYSEIISGIHTAAHENNYSVGFIRFFSELKDPVLFNNLIHEEEVGGVILVATDQVLNSESDWNIIEKIKSRLSKIVCVEWKCDGLSSVLFDRRETAQKALEFLYKKNYTDIGYIGMNDDRIAGVEKVLDMYNLDSSREKFVLGEAFNMKGGYDIAMKREKFPRAVLCGSDEVAIGVLSALNKRKIAVPGDVALMSIDNIESSAYTNPPLTTMNVQKKAMGERAVEMIVKGTCGKGDDAISIMLPAGIVQRESC